MGIENSDIYDTYVPGYYDKKPVREFVKHIDDQFDLRGDGLDGDGVVTLSGLLELIPRLQQKYGKHAQLSFDAGYNNVSVVIKPSKKVKK
jgi:hypothetical protein